MITEEEYNNIQIGDYIQIVDQWNEYTGETLDGKMDYLLGKTFEVTEKATKTTVEKCNLWGDFVIEKIEDGGQGWSLNLYSIAKVIKHEDYQTFDEIEKMHIGVRNYSKESIKSIDDEALKKMLMKSGLSQKTDCVLTNIAFSGK